MHILRCNTGRLGFQCCLWALLLALFASSLANPAQASGTKFQLVDNAQGATAFTQVGFTNVAVWDPIAASPVLVGPPIGETANWINAASGGSATATWKFGIVESGPGGKFGVEAYIPDDSVPNASGLTYLVQAGAQTVGGGCDDTVAYSTTATYSGVSQDNQDGYWLSLGTVSIQNLSCVRVVLSNASASSTARVWADAIRLQRLFESASTIPDMPKVVTATAAGTNFINSANAATPNVLVSLTYTCPRDGKVTVSGTGESAAVSNAGGAFIGLAYSISKNSTATDNSNVVQSSALSTFSGDANRDFLMVQRVDDCIGGFSTTYRLTGYGTTPQTKVTPPGTSFIWNPRLTLTYNPN
ncbi:MAG: hypothetical protein NT117_10535 [Gammaproteobacteria bacterium]|nr:hypothetical protein [Gammaproteobacteria bacterium]